MKSYRLNEISLIDRFTMETSSLGKLVHKGNQDQFTKETETSSLGKLTIDNKNFIDIKKNNVAVDNSVSEMFSSSVEYHGKDNTRLS